MTSYRPILAALSCFVLVACSSGSAPGNAGDARDADEAAVAPESSLPVGTGPCAGARPGAPVFAGPSQCSLNFVFRDGNGTEYIGTAGHCVLGDSPFGGESGGERTWPAGQGPEASDADGNAIGRFRYAVLEPPKDFALIQLANGVASNPQACHFGGPEGINSTTSSEPSLLRYYGSGLAIGDLLPARSALALSMNDPDEIFLSGVATPGDSGAPVLDTEGRAVGVLVTVGALLGGIGTDGIDAGTVGVTRLQPQLQRAREVLGRPGLRLVNDPAR